MIVSDTVAPPISAARGSVVSPFAREDSHDT